MTPPVGAAMYAGCTILECSIEGYMKKESLSLFIATVGTGGWTNRERIAAEILHLDGAYEKAQFTVFIIIGLPAVEKKLAILFCYVLFHNRCTRFPAGSASLRRMIDDTHDKPAAQGFDRVLIPGEKEYQTRLQCKKEGLPYRQKS